MADPDIDLALKLTPKVWPLEDAIIHAQPKMSKKECQRRKSVLNWLRRKWDDDHSTLRRCMSVLMLILYSFLGASIFYYIEGFDKNYWQCLFYVNSLYTTIGYGTVRAETNWGKAFTILYAIPGVPIMLVATSDMGMIIMYWIGKIWVKLRRIRRLIQRFLSPQKRNLIMPEIKGDDSIYQKGREDTLPLSFAFTILLLWLLGSTLYFCVSCEAIPSDPLIVQQDGKNCTFFISFYLLFISISTIGLGDYTPDEKGPKTIIDYALILGGIALFSLCVRLVIVKLETLDSKVAQNVINEYTESLLDNYAFDSVDGQMEKSEKQQKAIIHKLVRKKGSFWMIFFLGKRVEANMLREYRKRINMRIHGTQTELETRNVASMAIPDVVDAQTMTDDNGDSTPHFGLKFQFKARKKTGIRRVKSQRWLVEGEES